ncbi:MAG: prepilin-type N-terminal cleavage/methylation domain-containing protein, partial [Verrucomicrobiales bacterium]|nr:prepilin-type N-terminal cleavage/methylation domain-containing protein [Verrucomicrobiales bacterium]
MNVRRDSAVQAKRCQPNGFTLVEALITVAIIGVMAAAVISAFSNAAADSRRVIGRQQQAVVQASVTNWVSSQLGGASTVAQVRSLYNNTGTTPKTSLERLVLVG